MRKSLHDWRSWTLAFALATGGFWFIMAKDPPKVAANPAAAFSPLSLTIPSGLPIAEGGGTE